MKKTLNHLPKNKQDELRKLAKLIRSECDDIEKIILYGSYARGDYKEEKDLKPERKSGHVSDYDILVVTNKKRVALDTSFWNKISDKCANLNLSALPRLITHDIGALNVKLAEGQYFYSDVKKEGVMIFDAGNHELAEERNLSSKERQRIAQDHYDEWYISAEEFFAGYLFYLDRSSFGKAAFLLHQSAESAYKTVLLVFSNYTPSEHFLEFLGKRAEQYSARLKNIFASETKEDNARLGF